jgi:hypothetical protein
MKSYKTHYVTLPGSPYWNTINYDNKDNQPDYNFDLEKILETEHLIYKLLHTINDSNSVKKTYLEYIVYKKRGKL